MAYANEMSLSVPPILKGTVGGGPRMHPTKQQHGRRQHHPPPKSQPFDPEDLRRRLYVVIAEREAQNERRQRQRVDALPAKRAQVERERDNSRQHLYIGNLAAGEDGPTWAAPTTTTTATTVTSRPRPQQSSRQDKLRHRTSMVGPPSSSLSSEATDTTTGTGGYRHVPEQAAAQFSRTATQTGMQSDRSLVHSLSKAALRFYTEGAASAADRRAIESSITPGKQRSLLQRVRSQQERQHGRNQFQGDAVPAAAAPWRRPSMTTTAATATIMEEDAITATTATTATAAVSALADLHLHAYANQGGGGGGAAGGDTAGGELHSSEETLVDAATANEHRVDWSQSDQMLPHEKRGAGLHLPPLLRKTTSILSMRKIGNRPGGHGHLRKNSMDSNNSSSSGSGSGGDGRGHTRGRGEKLRIVTECDEQAEADADDGSTPMSPNSGSSRSGRLGIWARLKRG